MTRTVWLLSILLIVLIPGFAFCQKKADRELTAALDRHLLELQKPSDSTRQSTHPRAYLATQFQKLGIIPRGEDHGYTQATVLDEGRRFEPGTTLEINNHALTPHTDFMPLSYSGTGAVQGSPLIAVQERKQPWIIDISNYFDHAPTEPLLQDSLYNLARQAITDQATAVLFYNSKGPFPDLSFDASSPKAAPLTIPVAYLTGSASSRYLNDPTASVRVRLEVSIRNSQDTIYTVLAGIDHGAPTTTILAAKSPEDKSMLIELARILKDARKYGRENYLFVAFPQGKGDSSAIRAFAEHLPAAAGNPGCLLFLHDAAGTTLTVRGIQSSPDWEPLLKRVREGAPVRKTVEATDPLLHIPDLPELSFTGSGSNQPDGLQDVMTVRFLSSLVENLNRKGSPVAAHPTP